MDTVVRDVRYAMRGLRRSPGFLVTAVLTLGLGIGATATMYSVVRDVLLAPLPYPEKDRLVGIALTTPQEKPNAEQSGMSADFVRERARSFESVGLAEDSASGANLSTGSRRPLRISSTRVAQGYFPTLGVMPVVGRTFTAAEDLPGGPKVVLLSYWVWKRTFAGDPGIVNRVVRINEEPYTVVGVMPEIFSGNPGNPESQGDAGSSGVWLPLQLSTKDPGYEGTNYMMIGRLRANVTLAQAREEMRGLTGPFFAQFPFLAKWNRQPHEFTVQPLQAVVVSDVKQSLLVLLAAVLAVLLVACLNLAGLMTARAATRERELALRTALGATRLGLLRLMVTESVVLAAAGGVLGLGLAWLARPMLLAASPLAIPVTGHGGVLGVVGFVAAIALTTTLLCGLLPAWTVFRQDAQSALKGGQAAGTRVSQVRVGKGLMIGQVAVAMVLLSSASLLLGSFLKLRATPSGVQTRRLDVAQVSLKGLAYEKTLATDQFVEKVIGELEHTPGVERVAMVNGLPLDRGLNITARTADKPEMQEGMEFRTVTPGYFRTLGISLLAGRDFTADDKAGAPLVVVVNEKAAQQWWPGRSPIGERVVIGGKGEPELTVIGVVADTRNHSLIAPDRVMIYEPASQVSDGMTKIMNGWFATTFAIRLAGDVDVAAAVQQAVSHADAEVPVARLTTMQAVVDKTVSAPRFFSWLAGGFAGFALLLTVIGLFGLLSYQVTQRTREIGVRMAIGAGRGEILRLILGRGLVLTAIGLVAGGLMSLAVPKLVSSVLADVVVTGGAGIGGALSSSFAALGGAGWAMLVAAGLASWLPARRAAAVEPVEALRSE